MSHSSRFKSDDLLLLFFTIAVIGIWIWLFRVRATWQSIDLSESQPSILMRLAEAVVQRPKVLFLIFIGLQAAMLPTCFLLKIEVHRRWIKGTVWLLNALSIASVHLVAYALRLSLISY